MEEVPARSRNPSEGLASQGRFRLGGFRLLENVENGTGWHLPLSSLRVAPPTGEDMPLLLVNLRRVGAEVAARPPRFTAEQHDADLRFLHAEDRFSIHYRYRAMHSASVLQRFLRSCSATRGVMAPQGATLPDVTISAPQHTPGRLAC